MTHKSTPFLEDDPRMNRLVEEALARGATGAAIIAAADIVVEDALAEKCRHPGCPNYALSKSCPPHVAGPAAFKKQLEAFARALFFKIELPSEILYSSDRRELFELLHETAAGIERAAVHMGFIRARAFAGDSCKQIFCYSHKECRALLKNGTCRHPESARPSMSGFGIHVAKLYTAAGWTMAGPVAREADSPEDRMASICGLVLID
ncbi:MAG: DUF2284 domain-containing protein [Desulfosalsimonadaceae bacterium]